MGPERDNLEDKMNGMYLKVGLAVLAEQLFKGHSEVCSFRGSNRRRMFEISMFTGPKASTEKEVDERHYERQGR